MDPSRKPVMLLLLLFIIVAETEAATSSPLSEPKTTDGQSLLPDNYEGWPNVTASIAESSLTASPSGRNSMAGKTSPSHLEEESSANSKFTERADIWRLNSSDMVVTMKTERTFANRSTAENATTQRPRRRYHRNRRWRPIDYFEMSVHCFYPTQLIVSNSVTAAFIALGLPGNLLVAVVLITSPLYLKSTIIPYMLGITLSDTIILLLLVPQVIMALGFRYDAGFGSFWADYRPFQFAALQAFLSTSHWLAICFAVERLIVVVFPLKAKYLCKRSRSLAVCIVVFILSVLQNISLAFEFDRYTVYDRTSGKNATLLEWGGLWLNDTYRQATSVVAIILDVISPVVVVTCNLWICITLYKARRSREDMTGKGGTQGASNSLPRDGTRILVAISVVFIITYGPLMVSYIGWYDPTLLSSYALHSATCLYHTLLNFAAAIDFLLYFCASSKFRGRLRILFRRQS